MDINENQRKIYNCPKQIGKPQDKFKVKIDNSELLFEPRLRYKSNALTPLDVRPIYSKRGKVIKSHRHPYEYEIDEHRLQEWQMKVLRPIQPKPVAETVLHYVDTLDQLMCVLQMLRRVREIAIDLKEHTHRSFLESLFRFFPVSIDSFECERFYKLQGLTCLMQISTRKEDFIIDALALHDYMHVLNEVFTDPRIVKILHASSHNILCLERDFSLYIVNMFDTAEAVKRLKLQDKSLISLIQTYCNITLNTAKHMETDWRTCPLSFKQINYLRESTHYLPYIYDVLRNLLLKSVFTSIELVYQDSAKLGKSIYDKPEMTSPTELLSRSGKVFDGQQSDILWALNEWREKTARDLDESLEFVMPTDILVNVAECVPRNIKDLQRVCGHPNIPDFIQCNLSIILKLIEKHIKKRD